MPWLRGRWVSLALLGAGLVTTGCAGVVGAGAAVVVVGAGVLSMTCYDRVSVTVTDKLTGTELCDAKVTFFEGKSETKATSCYEAALATGKYKMRVERPGLVPYEVPVVIDTGRSCKHAVQTLYVALDRPNMPTAPQHIAPPGATTVAAPAPPPAPAATTGAPAAGPLPPPPATPPGANAAPSTFPPEVPPAPGVAPSAAPPPPASGTFPAP